MYGKARKFVKRGVKQVRKRYTAKPGGRKATGGVRVAKMAKDILYLKSVLNPEKKVDNHFLTNTFVGQVNGNADGSYFEDVTPDPVQGTTQSTRNGSSIKLHSSIWHMQFAQLVSSISNMKVIVEIWAIEKEPYTGFTWRDEHFKPNPFITGADIRDYNSSINPDNYMKGKCIARRKFTMQADQLGTEKYVKDLKIPLLYNKGQGRHVRYRGDGITVESGQLYLLVRTDRGNISGGVPSTLSGIPDVGLSTGLNMSYNVMNYFYDN